MFCLSSVTCGFFRPPSSSSSQVDSSESQKQLIPSEPPFLSSPSPCASSKWYFRAEESPKDPFSMLAPEWSPYGLAISGMIEESYLAYSLSKGCYDGRCDLGDYFVDFKKQVQISKKESWRQRPVQRFFSCPETVTRRLRFEKGLVPVVCEVSKIDEAHVGVVQESQKIRFEQVFPDEASVELDVSIDVAEYFKTCPLIWSPIPPKTLIRDYYLHQFDIEHEIFAGIDREARFLGGKCLRESQLYQTKYSQSLKNDFCPTIIAMYTEEGFVYRRLNKILRDQKHHKLENFLWYYLALLYSLKKCSKSLRVFERDKKIKIEKLYRGCFFSPEQLNTLKEIPLNTILVNYDNLSTSYSLPVATKFLKNVLLEITVVATSDEERLSFIEDYSEFGSEKEVLLGSGAKLSLNNFSKQAEGFYSLDLTLLSSRPKVVAHLLATHDIIHKRELGKSERAEDWSQVMRALGQAKSLTRLQLSGYSLERDEISSICSALVLNLKMNQGLTDLRLSGNWSIGGIKEWDISLKDSATTKLSPKSICPTVG
eukprot:TRINITY_DN887_c0_g1_i1.p1 TRINITY_DN887_c0_g1~~TRINITY_DN887_c0_g1_i1.p1  ORF type:complete len:540 (-),score=88.68 TRINITY_DN887_c0_g1_i1:358-1977(-)